MLQNFISHYVQIKRTMHVAAENPLIHFISHYVQIKLGHVQPLHKRRNVLYIPLRSDKTFEGIDNALNFLFFISHYVQIKPTPILMRFTYACFFISHYVQIKRIYADQKEKSQTRLYIPLRSDKTRIDGGPRIDW